MQRATSMCNMSRKRCNTDCSQVELVCWSSQVPSSTLGSVNLGKPAVRFSYPFQISPDGEHVVFVGPDATGKYGVIRMMKLDGTGHKQLTSPPDSLSSAAVGAALGVQ